MHKLEKLILETYAQLTEVNPEDQKGTVKFKDLPASQQKSLIARYGEPKWPQYDFLSSDGEVYFRTSSVDKETGNIGHSVIKLPSFTSMYHNFSNIIKDIKKLMGSDDVRKDEAAREFFEITKTNFRKLQRYLRTERPEQYRLLKMQRLMEGIESSMLKLETKFNSLNESLLDEVEDEPTPEQEPDPKASKETVLEDATDQILAKFPTLKAAIIKLQTEDFKEFVDSIDWISPRPTEFRINLKNGQDYILKWTGTGFEAQVMGKRYYIDKIDDYQQALDKLAILYKEGPMTGAGEGEPADVDTGGAAGGGGGDFPGDDAAGGGGEEGGDLEDLGGEEGGEEGGADLTGEPIDFEEPAEEPEA